MNKKFSGGFFYETHLSYEGIALYADALILNKVEQLPPKIRDHAEDCQQCKKEIFAIYELTKNDPTIRNIERHPFFSNPEIKYENTSKLKIYHYLKIAAVFLLIIGFGLLLNYLIISKHASNSSKSQIIGSIKNDNKTNIQSGKKSGLEGEKALKADTSLKLSLKGNEIALNMQKSEIFENLIASHYRSIDVEVLSPTLNQQFSVQQSIVFKFKGDLSVPLVVMVYNNAGGKILEKDNILANHYTFHPGFSPGLYYWKLIRDDDLLYVGKFFVK